MRVIEITRAYLVANGFDGLVQPDAECGCLVDSLYPCESCGSECEPGYRGVCKDDPGEWAIYRTKEAALASVQAAQSKQEEKHERSI